MPASTIANPRGRGRLTAADTEQLETHLLDSAQALFIEQGYARATMDAIARAAGISRKTLYARYAGKSDELHAVVNRLLDAALAAPAASAPASQSSTDPRTSLLRIARELATLSALTQVAGLNRLILAEASQAPDLARLFLDLHSRAADTVCESFASLQREGTLPKLRSPRVLALIFIEMVASLPRLRAMLGHPLSPREVREMTAVAVDVFLGGCQAG